MEPHTVEQHYCFQHYTLRISVALSCTIKHQSTDQTATKTATKKPTDCCNISVRIAATAEER
jgi:hypothetical protein